jgi:hypothetical protein
MEKMTNPAAFNRIAKITTSQLAPYKKAIALMKDLRDNWGPDAQGQYFDFSAYYDPEYKKVLLIGDYGSKEKRKGKKTDADTNRIRTIVIGLPVRRPDNYPALDKEEMRAKAFEVLSGYSQGNETPAARLKEMSNFAMYSIQIPETVDRTVSRFVTDYMSDHPKFQQAVQAAASAVTTGTKARSPVAG